MIRLLMTKWVSTVSVLGLLTGCASYPLGMDKDEWGHLSPAQKLDARMEQAQLDKARAQQRAAAARNQQSVLAAWQQERWHAGERAAPGQRVQCLLDGEMRSGGRWVMAEPTVVDLVAGWTDTIWVASSDRIFAHEVYGTFDGATVSLCPTMLDVQYRTNHCLHSTAAPRAFQNGVSGSGEVRRAWRGNVECFHSL